MCLELRHIRYVIAADEFGSFRKAAAALGVHESAVSRRIRDLEDELGAALFIRRHSGVSVTQAGSRFVYGIRKAMGQISRAATDVASFGRGEIGLVRIGILTSLATGFLTDLLKTYVQRHPTVRPDFVEGEPGVHIPAIQRHELDVAFLTGAPTAEGCDIAHLWNERVLVVLPKDHELSGQREIDWTELRNRHFIVSECGPGPEMCNLLIKHLADPGHHPNIERHAIGRDNLLNLVAMGQGLTLTNEATMAAKLPGVVYRPLRGEILPFYAIWSPQNDNPALRRLISLAKMMSGRSNATSLPALIRDPSTETVT